MNAPTIDDYRASYERFFDHYNDLVQTLTDEQLAVQSLCPDWTVRDVIAHVAGVEAVLDGWAPSAETPPPFERMGALHTELAALKRADLAERVRRITDSRLVDLGGLPPTILDTASITPVGVATYGRFLQIRNFDMWVHARDIAIPLGLDAPFGDGFAARNALREVSDAVGYIVGKKIGLPEGMSIVFHIGDLDETIAVRVDGRAAPVPAVESPDVDVRANVETFVMLAAGRIDPEAEIAAGRIAWSGDETWGPVAVRNLAYTG